jgi:hypothetical protein
MNKFVFLLFLSLLLISAQVNAIELTTPPPPPVDELPIPEEPTQAAVKVSIGSIGGLIDDAAIRAVRQIVGHAVATQTVGVFVVTIPRKNGPIPIEGGLSFCAEAGFNVVDSGFNEFVNELKSIQPKSGTFYNINLADRCPVTLENNDDVFCTEDAKICPDGTGVGRVPPSCEFAPCPGEEQMPVDDESLDQADELTTQDMSLAD